MTAEKWCRKIVIIPASLQKRSFSGKPTDQSERAERSDSEPDWSGQRAGKSASKRAGITIFSGTIFSPVIFQRCKSGNREITAFDWPIHQNSAIYPDFAEIAKQPAKSDRNL